jgi:chemotaxis protein MotB
MNRRISIIVLNKKTEEGIVNSANLDDFTEDLLKKNTPPVAEPIKADAAMPVSVKH